MRGGFAAIRSGYVVAPTAIGDTLSDQYDSVHYRAMADYGGNKHDVEVEGTRKMVKRMLKACGPSDRNSEYDGRETKAKNSGFPSKLWRGKIE